MGSTKQEREKENVDSDHNRLPPEIQYCKEEEARYNITLFEIRWQHFQRFPDGWRMVSCVMQTELAAHTCSERKPINMELTMSSNKYLEFREQIAVQPESCGPFSDTAWCTQEGTRTMHSDNRQIRSKSKQPPLFQKRVLHKTARTEEFAT